MLKMKNIRLLLMMVCVIFVMIGCSNATDEENASESSEGTEISVLLPTELPDEMIKEFEEETNIKVKIETASWDNIQDKIVSSLAAGVAPADVTEFDWSWVGQFGSAGWYTPLNENFDQDYIDDTPTMESFKYQGDYLAVPYLNDFRVSFFNQDHFDEAGIKEVPETPEELLDVAKKIKREEVVDYPIGLPLSASEGTTTAWFTMVKAFGGKLFDDNWKPLFKEKDSAGYQAMAFIINSFKEEELIDPANISLNNVDIYDNFQAGESAIDLAGVPGIYERYRNPDKSEISDAVDMMHVPSTEGEIHTFSLPEALAVPEASENKEAAIEFITWVTKPENVERLYLEREWLPNRLSVLEKLNEEGNLSGGDTLLNVLKHEEPLFLEGAPPWYPEFSTDVSTAMNQMAKGSLTVEEGMEKIVESTKSYID